MSESKSEKKKRNLLRMNVATSTRVRVFNKRALAGVR